MLSAKKILIVIWKEIILRCVSFSMLHRLCVSECLFRMLISIVCAFSLLQKQIYSKKRYKQIEREVNEISTSETKSADKLLHWISDSICVGEEKEKRSSIIIHVNLCSIAHMWYTRISCAIFTYTCKIFIYYIWISSVLNTPRSSLEKWRHLKITYKKPRLLLYGFLLFEFFVSYGGVSLYVCLYSGATNRLFTSAWFFSLLIRCYFWIYSHSHTYKPSHI